MEEPRGTPGVRAGKICHRFIDSHHKEPNERTNEPPNERTNERIDERIDERIERANQRERTDRDRNDSRRRTAYHVRVHRSCTSPHPSISFTARYPLPPSFFPSLGSPPPSPVCTTLHLRISVDAVIVRCSSRCIVIRNNDFIKIHASMLGCASACVRTNVRAWVRACESTCVSACVSACTLHSAADKDVTREMRDARITGKGSQEYRSRSARFTRKIRARL